MEASPSFVVVGAGAIGGFVGLLLHRAGFKVRFLVRERARTNLMKTGMSALCSTDPSFRVVVEPGAMDNMLTSNDKSLTECSHVLVATKRTANIAVHQQLVSAGVRCPVLFLQNGVRVLEDLGELPYEGVECVVSFNVVLDQDQGSFTLNQAMADAKLVLDGNMPSASSAAKFFEKTSVNVSAENDFVAMQAGKLGLNMTNAVNALSGLSILGMMSQAEYRRVLAASMDEMKAVFRAHGIEPKPSTPSEATLVRFFPTLLRLPNCLFMALVGARLKGRGEGYTSMAQDLKMQRVPTEIDFLNGSVVRLGKEKGVPTPVNEKLVELVKQAEANNTGMPGISGSDLQKLSGVSSRCCL